MARSCQARLPGVAVLRPYEGKTSGGMAEGLTRREIGLRYRHAMASAAQAARELPEKSLFRIGEVSRLTATKTFVLRYWESEFPSLQPVKSPSGHRLYRREDIETVFEIKRLLYEEGFTIAGARKHLADQNGSNGSAAARGESHREVARAVEAPAKHVPASRAHRKFLLDLHEELLAVLTLLERE
jgi:DNA-binding transcriptional MerR regulator